MEFAAYATRTIDVDNMVVQRMLFGRKHVFASDVGEIEVRLPAATAAYSFREGLTDFPDDPEHTWFGFYPLELRIELAEPIEFDDGDDQFNTNSVFTKQLDSVYAGIEAAFDQGFDTWRRTIRWTAFAPELDMSEDQTQSSHTVGKGFKIIRKQDGAVFRNHGGRYTSYGGGKVGVDAWEAAASALASGIQPPPWIDYIFDAIRKNVLGQKRTAIVSSAIACETLIRAVLTSILPVTQNEAAEWAIDNVSVQGLLARWDKLVGYTKAECVKNGKKDVHALFDLRNRVMHSGITDKAQLGQISRLLPGVLRFILSGDADLNRMEGNPTMIFPALREMERLTAAK